MMIAMVKLTVRGETAKLIDDVSLSKCIGLLP